MKASQTREAQAVTMRILRVKQVAERLGISTNSVWYRANPKHRLYDKHFPKPFKISPNATGWLESEISEYIANLAKNRHHTAEADK